MAGTFFRGDPPLVVNLRRGHVPVAEQLLHLPDVDTGIQQERGGRCPQ